MLLSNGDSITISFATPITCQFLPCHFTVSPNGFSNPICLAADSFKIKPNESVASCLEKLRPAAISHFTASAYSGSISIVPNTACVLGSLPFQSKLFADELISVIGLDDLETV